MTNGVIAAIEHVSLHHSFPRIARRRRALTRFRCESSLSSRICALATDSLGCQRCGPPLAGISGEMNSFLRGSSLRRSGRSRRASSGRRPAS
jgi:hypothetical protein